MQEYTIENMAITYYKICVQTDPLWPRLAPYGLDGPRLVIAISYKDQPWLAVVLLIWPDLHFYVCNALLAFFDLSVLAQF